MALVSAGRCVWERLGEIGRDSETVKGCHAAHVEDVSSSFVVVVELLASCSTSAGDRTRQASAQLGKRSARRGVQSRGWLDR